MKQKLVLAWVDRTGGFELTGRFRGPYAYQPETRTVPKAHAAVWGDDTPALRDRLTKHVEQESSNHDWVGFFLLDYKDDVLNVARTKALEAAT
jgi:hypothetical protein